VRGKGSGQWHLQRLRQTNISQDVPTTTGVDTLCCTGAQVYTESNGAATFQMHVSGLWGGGHGQGACRA